MATTATPTLFPAHNIGNESFLDGGIYLNNPTLTAYNEAIRYNVSDKKFSILSLGTGNCRPDPLRPNLYWDKLFWSQNFYNDDIFTLSTQEDNIDCEMHEKLGNRYQRWQVWLEEPIRIDDFESVPYLLEIGHQFMEELDCSDENPLNKLV
ncbi:16317_t:CDS:1, partial [Acaulospora colombiana]